MDFREEEDAEFGINQVGFQIQESFKRYQRLETRCTLGDGVGGGHLLV